MNMQTQINGSTYCTLTAVISLHYFAIHHPYSPIARAK